MISNMLEIKQSKVFSARFKPKAASFQALVVVYKIAPKQWRGFVHPYGETSEGPSKEVVLGKLRVLTDAYYETAKSYGFPSHLMNGHMGNLMDREVFRWVISNTDFMKKVHSGVGRADSKDCYVETYRGKS
ncbi:MAG: hypothetical protein Q7S49_02660 [bacterium]|nr:hypothetical protein [bacterium]